MPVQRLQKILARAGVASRRASEALITGGRVRVNGHIVTELGSSADPRKDRIEVDGKRLVAESLVYVILHKPRGTVSTMSDPEGRPSVKELLTGIEARVFPIGRLDFATSGALLATNDGDFADGLMHPRKLVPKTYVLKVKGDMKPEDVDRWRQGVRLEDGMTLPAQAKILRYEEDKTWLELTITEGRNQQIRRMGEATGFRVMRLARISFAGITTEGVRPGQWRHLTREELVELKKTYGVPRSVAAPPPAPPTRAPVRRTDSSTARGGRPRVERGAGRGSRGASSTDQKSWSGDKLAGRAAHLAGRGANLTGARGSERGGPHPERGGPHRGRGGPHPERGRGDSLAGPEDKKSSPPDRRAGRPLPQPRQRRR